MQKSNFASPRLAEAVPRVLLISAAMALSACGGGGAGNAPSPSPAPTPAPTPSPSPLPTPTPTPSPTPAPTPSTSPSGTVCGSAFQGAANAIFTFASCTGCTTSEPENAVDNDEASSAEVSIQGAGGAVTLRATAQPGVVVPSGRRAGALIAFPNEVETSASSSLNIVTFLNGAQQESGGGFNNVASPTINPPGSSNRTPQFYGFPNSKPYDRIDVIVERRGSASNGAIQIFEICSE